ncbi:Oxygen regulatory protein NreC [compost metagenome]
MNLVDNKQQLPAGLVDGAIEFFIHQHEIKCLYNGKTYTFENFPAEVLDKVEADFAKNVEAIKALVDWDITDYNEQLRQYIACRFGGFDYTPDITADNEVQTAEYVDCGRRGKCKYEGKLCSSIKVANGILTQRELEVLKLVAIGLLDKEIIEKLFISQDTLRSHKENISVKAGVSRKPQLTALAYQLNLI